ncbi:MAG TPA: hypothetical protein VFV20_09960 [Candidatus Limnocylindria bacterium]|nr:hypothetical protein [Candidatus Limnocylindria bacterium]
MGRSPFAIDRISSRTRSLWIAGPIDRSSGVNAMFGARVTTH